MVKAKSDCVRSGISALWPVNATGKARVRREIALHLLRHGSVQKKMYLGRVASDIGQTGIKKEAQAKCALGKLLKRMVQEGFLIMCGPARSKQSGPLLQLNSAYILEQAQQTQGPQQKPVVLENSIGWQRQQVLCHSYQQYCTHDVARQGTVQLQDGQRQSGCSLQLPGNSCQQQAQQPVLAMQLKFDPATQRYAALWSQIGASRVEDHSAAPAAKVPGAPAAEDAASEDAAVASLLKLLPKSVRPCIQPCLPAVLQPALVELHADAGCNIFVKLDDHSRTELPCSMDVQKALKRLRKVKNSNSSSSRVSADLFGPDNRAGVPGTLHRISAIRGRSKSIIGLTYRVGRHVSGMALLLADVLSSMAASIRDAAIFDAAGRPQSLLLLGRPGVGKTTLLRDIARLMSLPASMGGLGLTVVIVDTSNEIAGDATERHPCIGNARRLMVPHRHRQAQVLVEAIENHCPDVIIVDEIGTAQEVAAARTISQRGVLLVGTAHGANVGDLLRNRELNALVGGVAAVTVGDGEAKLNNAGHKTRMERAGSATFVTLVELMDRSRWRVHMNVEQSVDMLLRQPCQQNMYGHQHNVQEQHQQLQLLRGQPFSRQARQHQTEAEMLPATCVCSFSQLLRLLKPWQQAQMAQCYRGHKVKASVGIMQAHGRAMKECSYRNRGCRA